MMQALHNRLADFKTDKAISLPSNDVAWSETSAIYSVRDFEKYNPDDLIGRRGFGIYRRMMIDEQVKAVVKFKRDAITARDWFFEIDNKNDILSEQEIERRIALSYFTIDKLQDSWMDVLNGVMSAIYNGFSMTEKLFTEIEYDGATWNGLKSLKLKPYNTFYFRVDDYGNILKLVQKMNGREQNVDIRKFIHYLVNPDIDDQYGGSELREAYRAWFSKDVIYKFRNMYLERHAGGYRWIQAREGKTIHPNSQEFRNLQEVLSNIQTSTGLILPNSVEMHSDYPANNVAFKESISDCDTAIARALLVPNLLGVSPQGDVGSYAQSTNQLEAFLWTLKADAKRLEEALNEQVFRQLGESNFGDDFWPKFKFKPATGTMMLEIIKTWKELVAGKAVRATDTDESHLRELMDFPEAGEEINQQEISQNDGSLEDSGNGTDDPDVSDDLKDNIEGEEGDEELKKDKKIKKEKKDETVIGNSLISVAAFDRAMRRVDFKVIDKNSDIIIDDSIKRIDLALNLVIDDLLEKFKAQGEVEEKIGSSMRTLKVDSKLKTKLNKTVREGLKEGSDLGEKHAKFEIDKAKHNVFSRSIDMERIDMLAKDFLNNLAFKITGDFTNNIVSILEQEVLNGSKKGMLPDQILDSMFGSLARKGYISPERVKELGLELGGDYQVRTVIKTATFEAINSSRYNYFTDPALGDFVQAFEYSAILDSRTTEICKHLDEQNAGNHSKEWYEQNPQFRPPNHFNCRSVLIPVTLEDVDEYKEGPTPRIQPQSGFG